MLGIAYSYAITTEPSSSEFEIAIVTLKIYISPGTDQIPAELIQAGGDTLQL
jgi:hypothetical protein